MLEDKILKMNEDAENVFSTHEKRTYTVEEIQNILGVGKNVAYNLVKTKAFHSVRIGGNIRISKRSFDAWLDGKTDAMEEVQTDE